MDGVTGLAARLLFGTGMRLLEGLRLRVGSELCPLDQI
jgi:hypothetical protein